MRASRRGTRQCSEADAEANRLQGPRVLLLRGGRDTAEGHSHKGGAKGNRQQRKTIHVYTKKNYTIRNNAWTGGERARANTRNTHTGELVKAKHMRNTGV